MEPLSVGVHSVANLGDFKSDQVSHPSGSEACHLEDFRGNMRLICRSVSFSVPDQLVYFVWP